jgi:hypothetical protein
VYQNSRKRDKEKKKRCSSSDATKICCAVSFEDASAVTNYSQQKLPFCLVSTSIRPGYSNKKKKKIVKLPDCQKSSIAHKLIPSVPLTRL